MVWNSLQTSDSFGATQSPLMKKLLRRPLKTRRGRQLVLAPTDWGGGDIRGWRLFLASTDEGVGGENRGQIEVGGRAPAGVWR
jgi:hypothetical protein